jgi:hypothetical protein
MIKHVVLFRFKKESKNQIEKAKEVLLSMQGNVPTAKQITVYLDELKTARSYDIMLEVIVDNFTALEEYQADPYHCEVIKTHMHKVRESSIAVDVEL